MGRSILALLAGFLEVVVLSTATDSLMQATGVFPASGQPPMSDGLFLLATGYRPIYGIAGSYIAARLAPKRPMFHAMALGVVGFAASTAGAIATWNSVPSMGPHWYPVALVVTALPAAWLGGTLFHSQVER